MNIWPMFGWFVFWPRQAFCLFVCFYHLSHVSNPFCLGYFGDKVERFSQASLDCDSPIYASHVAGMPGAHHYA
jgi:hypothetical protein